MGNGLRYVKGVRPDRRMKERGLTLAAVGMLVLVTWATTPTSATVGEPHDELFWIEGMAPEDRTGLTPQPLADEETDLTPQPLADEEGERLPEDRDAETGELLGERTLMSKTYALDATGRMTRISQSPLHYAAADGSFQDIDARLVRTADGFENTRNVFQTTYGPDGTFTIHRAGVTATWEPLGLALRGWEGETLAATPAPRAVLPVVEGEGNVLRLPGVLPGVTEVYDVERGYVKHDVVLDAPLFEGTLSTRHDLLAVEGLLRLDAGMQVVVDGAPVTEDFVTPGGVRFLTADGTTAFRMQSVVAYDADGGPGSTDGSSVGGSIVGTFTEAGLRLALAVPATWAHADATTYPITIDPTWEWTPVDDSVTLSRTEVDEGFWVSNYANGIDALLAREDSTDCEWSAATCETQYRALLRQDLSPIHAKITSVERAQVLLYHMEDATTTQNVLLVPQDWWDSATVRWKDIWPSSWMGTLAVDGVGWTNTTLDPDIVAAEISADHVDAFNGDDSLSFVLDLPSACCIHYVRSGDRAPEIRIEYTIDEEPPIITSELSGKPGNSGWFRGPVTINATCEDVGPAGCHSINGEPLPYTVVVETEGHRLIELKGMDKVQNVFVIERYVLIDMTPPILCDGLCVEYLDMFIQDDWVSFGGTRGIGSAENIDFQWGTGTAHPELGSDEWGVVWHGYLTAPVTGEYLFHTDADDGMHVTVGWEWRHDDWETDTPGIVTSDQPVFLTAGQKVAFATAYYDASGEATARLYWTVPGQEMSIIPSSAFDYLHNQTFEATSPQGAMTSFLSPIHLDAVSGMDFGLCRPASWVTIPIGNTTVSCPALDRAGNDAGPVEFTVSVVDTTAPVIEPHADETWDATSPDGAIVDYTPPSWSDAVNGTGTASCVPLSGSLFPFGETTVTCEAPADPFGNQPVPTAFNITVVDATAPLIHDSLHVQYFSDETFQDLFAQGFDAAIDHYWDQGSPLPGLAADHFSVRWTGTLTAPVAGEYRFHTDTDDGARLYLDGEMVIDDWERHAMGTPVTSPAIVLEAGQEVSLRLDVFEDMGHAGARLLWTVPGEARAVVPPSAFHHASDGNITLEAAGADGTDLTYLPITWSDAVDGTGTAACTPESGTRFPLGDTLVTCSATDGTGNAGSGSIVVSVVDTTPPVIEHHPDVVQEATAYGGAAIGYEAPAWTDGVDGHGNATCAPSIGSFLPFGDHTVVCGAVDSAGNEAVETSFVVHVVPGPVDRVVVSPQDKRVNLGVPVAFSAIGYDQYGNQDGVVSTWSAENGTIDAEGVYTGTAAGAWQVSATIGDATGSATINVTDILVLHVWMDEIRPDPVDALTAGVHGRLELAQWNHQRIANVTIEIEVTQEVARTGVRSTTIEVTSGPDGTAVFTVPEEYSIAGDYRLHATAGWRGNIGEGWASYMIRP